VVIGNAIVRFLVRRIRAQSEQVKPTCLTASPVEAKSGRVEPNIAAVSATAGPTRVNNAPDPDACAIYIVAMRRVIPDSTTVTVVYDSVSIAMPSFALHGVVERGKKMDVASRAFSDSVWNAMRIAHRDRHALPSCVASDRRIVRVSYDSIVSQFRPEEDGWLRFNRTFPQARAMMILGKPLYANPQRTESFLHVAHASQWLTGTGELMQLRKVNGAWEVVASHARWTTQQHAARRD
jgi:hypothetical protein